ncbi:MAG: phosphate uptake regulator PhoU [Candidatus Bathyarchaeota archaeon]|nr:phosphate uptake regulator PhoU [Candidatus Bathyarchaeota archaeon]
MSREKSNEELRKIQVTGGSTYIISLPKTWIDKMGLKRSSVVSIIQRDDMSLSIQPKGIESPERVKKVIIVIKQGEKPDSVVRRLVSSYINGYNIIQIRSTEKRIDLESRFAIKDFVRKKLVGTEILSDLPNELTLQILLSYSELSVKDALRRMSIIAASMHRDAVQTLSTDNPRIAKEVVNMDDEVDRFSFYVIRLLNVAAMDAHVLKESGIKTPRQCLSYRLITKSVERMADHATNIAQNRLALHLVPINDEILIELNRISLSAIKVFEASIEALFDEEYSEADEVLEAAEETRGMEDEVIHKIVKLAPVEDVPQLRLIVESIMRTSEYGTDIAETVLNMTVSDAVTEA